MEDHEIVDRYRRGLLSDEAKPIADEILRSRGIDRASPPPEVLEDPALSKPRQFNPRLVPSLFGVFAAGTAGRQIGALLGGAIGAGLVAALAFYIGWKVGRVVANYAHRQPRKLNRFLIATAATVAWALVVGFVGVVLQVGQGAVR